MARICILAGASILANCDNSSSTESDPLQINGDPTPEQLVAQEAATTLRTGFATPNPDGTFDSSLTTILKGGYRDDAGNGYAFELGRDGTAFSALVELLPETDLGALPATGIATMRGEYQVIEVGKSDGDVRDYGEPVATSGRLTLRADFDFATLQGSDGTLNIDGTFDGQSLSGAAYFNARAAELSGRIGSEHAVGIF
ncbi:hypothetical protein [Planktotalea sp.]|uniref:hypothetical protein n=1 Tax=Planktotalea sp. TaxID=2029877 RepID=UPI0025FDF0B5|nr:hypothetical protein [Planktotalea sp.]